MNVYKITHNNPTYGGGVAVVAADYEEEAVRTFKNNTDWSYEHDFNSLGDYTAELLEDVNCNTKDPKIITEGWYYE